LERKRGLSDSVRSAAEARGRFFYGYIVVMASVVVMTLTFGVNYSFGVFFNSLRDEFGWTKAVTSGAYSIVTFLAGFLGIFAGRFSDRFGARVVTFAGGLFLGAGCLLMSRITAAWQFYLIYALVVPAGIGGVWPSLTSTVPKWFMVRRGLMTGVVASGVGIGILVVPPVVSRLLPVYGWRASYVILGISSLVLILGSAALVRPDPHQRCPAVRGRHAPEQRDGVLSYGEVAHNRDFWTLCLIYFCFGVSLHTVMVHLVPHAVEMGIPLRTAAELMIFVGGASIMSKLVAGAISDRIGVRLSLAYNFGLLIIGLLWLQIAGSLWALRLFAFALGFAYGGIMTMQPLLSAELFGLTSLGLILGGISFVYATGSAAGPLLSGYVFDLTGSYSIAFLICTVLDVLALVLVLRMIVRKKA
jgi:MFS transporter, OFA family, oxalate/formate antiporter